ncbi:hypothetical protein ACHAWF_014803 [Thalassiosira exigua]
MTSHRLLHLLALSCCLLSLLSSVASTTAGPPSSSSKSPGPLRPREGVDPPAGGRADVLDGDDGYEPWRRSLPPGLCEGRGAPLHRVDLGEGVVLYLLGSSHVSRASCEDAKLLVNHVRPDVLFVELCSQRVGLMMDPPARSEPESKQRTKQDGGHPDMSPLTRKGSLMYANIQSDYAKKLNVTIGGEFREAFQSALSQQRQFWESERVRPWGEHDSYLERRADSDSASHPRGNRPCAIILGDRPVRITMLRAWESLRLIGKVKLILGLIWSSIWQPSEKQLREWMESILNDRTGKNDLITKAMEEMGRAFPTLKRVIIEERDEFMVAKLRQTAEALTHDPDHYGDKVIVALVGAGHCPGMLEKLDKSAEPNQSLPSLVETKRRKVSNDPEVASMVTDIVQFDYSYVWDSEIT